MSATWLADALRAAGCRVDESIVPDWKSRGHTDGPFSPVGVLGHHTGGPAAGDLPSLHTVRDGRPDLAGPLANLMLSRAGVWVPISAGRPWHAGDADVPSKWPWVPRGDGNGYLIGIEAESSGAGDWTPAQIEAYPRGVAALLRYLGAGANRFLGHKEWAPSRKPDPARWPGDMDGFRATVTNFLNGIGDDDMALTDRLPVTADGKAGTVTVAEALASAWELGRGKAFLNSQVPVMGPDGKATAASISLGTLLAWFDNNMATLRAQNAALLTALQSVAGGEPIDLDAVKAAAQEGAAVALQGGVKVTVDVPGR